MKAKRILTVSSGKGGVGKSTFAVNFSLALARVAPTVLVDLDTGTSSVRNTIDVPVKKDLYHFFRKGEPLEACLTTLPDKLDPHGHFRNFAFVAAPKHAMEEFINFEDMHRYRLMRAINELPARFVVLDLRAGLDAAVLDFLPHSNSGILVFTPHHPAATAAAGDIVKALIFRKLRLVLSEEGPLAKDRKPVPTWPPSTRFWTRWRTFTTKASPTWTPSSKTCCWPWGRCRRCGPWRKPLPPFTCTSC